MVCLVGSSFRSSNADRRVSRITLDLSTPELGGIAIRESIARAGVTASEIDEVIMGCVLPAGLGQAPARQAALKGGLPSSIGAVTINKVCGSGLKAVMLADQEIRAEDARLIISADELDRAESLTSFEGCGGVNSAISRWLIRSS